MAKTNTKFVPRLADDAQVDNIELRIRIFSREDVVAMGDAAEGDEINMPKRHYVQARMIAIDDEGEHHKKVHPWQQFAARNFAMLTPEDLQAFRRVMKAIIEQHSANFGLDPVD